MTHDAVAAQVVLVTGLVPLHAVSAASTPLDPKHCTVRVAVEDAKPQAVGHAG